VKTGEYQSVFTSLFSGEEAAVWAAIQTEKKAQLEDEIRLLTMREWRMMRRIEELRQAAAESAGFVLTEQVEEDGFRPGDNGFRPGDNGGPYTLSRKKREGVLGQIQAVEEALTRVQNSKAKAIELLMRLEAELPGGSGNTVQQFLDALDAKAEEVWADEQEDEEEAGP
jgi:hypothetical protein